MFQNNSLRVIDKAPGGEDIDLPQNSVNGYYAVSPAYLDEIAETLKECARFSDEN